MKVKATKFLQMGGQVEQAPQEQAPQGGQGNPEEQLMQVAQQIIQQMGPEASMLLAQMIMQMLQGAEGGGEQPAPQGEPVYAKKGGKLVLIGRR